MGIAEIHEDIIRTHILTRLDGRSLAAAGCTSSRLQSLSSDHRLWSDICSSNWPSTQHPVATQAIVNFTSGHRSFFSDAFLAPSHRLMTTASSHRTTEIISAVDIRYQNQLVVSKIESTNTTPSKWFQSTPFRIDLLEPKELVEKGIKVPGDDQAIQLNLEKHMTLSWILIDPRLNRAVNLSSIKPVSVNRNWLTDEVELTFAIVTAVDYDLHENSHVICNVEVTCGVKGGGSELYVSGVSLTVQDIDGKCLNGKDSMVILEGVTVAERRWCHGGGEEYGGYIQRRRERKEKMEMRERRLDMVRVACVMGFLMAFWSMALY
ncbi:hypothetical protein E3N88_13968 [Mikania micrantha]|uniref:F-box domain-containing protein n=1 Tax=Mikania micrantha TaxID=192012 RepID=A0A5N6P1C1_9ASTR|nr:hypothetical protein E3N88_13968 [Mikania micrantha]